MTPTDELWIDMAQFDTRRADGIWDGEPPPGDAPAWCSDIAALISAARAAPTADELSAEEATVAHMAETILGSGRAVDEAPAGGDRTVLRLLAGGAHVDGGPDAVPDDRAATEGLPGGSDVVRALHDAGGTDLAPAAVAGPVRRAAGAPADDPSGVAEHLAVHRGAARHRDPEPAHMADAGGGGGHGLRLVKRLVAVKAVAVTTAVALGITAAAATTRIVAEAVDPPRPRVVEPAPPPTTAPDPRPEDGDGDGPDDPGGRLRLDDEMCAAGAGCSTGDGGATLPSGAGTPSTVPTTAVPRTTVVTEGTATTATTATTMPSSATTATTMPSTTSTSVTPTSATSVPPTSGTTVSGAGGPDTLSAADTGEAQNAAP